jgi:hypothetical protein
MRVLVRGLPLSGASGPNLFPPMFPLRKLFHSFSILELQSASPFVPFPLQPRPPSLRRHLTNRTQICLRFRQFHSSPKTLAEDAQASRPPNIPEAEWQRMNDEFERRLAKRSWFFRPLLRFIGHPQYQVANLTLQIVLVGGVVGLWLYMWFFMGYANAAPPRTDGSGKILTDEEIEETETIENYLHSHPVVQAIRSQKYLIESGPHWAIPDKDIPHNFTGGTLRGLGRVSVAPIAFMDGDGTEFYAVCHIGRDLCGPHGMVHDGILATIVDESLARCCFPALPNRIGVTANLNITFVNPLPADSYILVRVLQIYILHY